jgi:hypothetical protein
MGYGRRAEGVTEPNRDKTGGGPWLSILMKEEQHLKTEVKEQTTIVTVRFHKF